jgi:hypothetical protein
MKGEFPSTFEIWGWKNASKISEIFLGCTHKVIQTYIISDRRSPLLSGTTKRWADRISALICSSTAFFSFSWDTIEEKFWRYALLQEHSCQWILSKIQNNLSCSNHKVQREVMLDIFLVETIKITVCCTSNYCLSVRMRYLMNCSWYTPSIFVYKATNSYFRYQENTIN